MSTRFTRRGFLQTGAAAGASLFARRAAAASAVVETERDAIARAGAAPVLRRELWPDPIRIASVELLKGKETKEVADRLTLPIAGGEEETSLRRFRSMIERNVVDVVQPDLFYFGGFVRSMRVARMAAAAGMPCTPHMSDGGLGYLYVAHFASCVPNAGPFQEYKGRDESFPVTSDSSSLNCVDGTLKVPAGPGLGVTIDPVYVKAAVALS